MFVRRLKLCYRFLVVMVLCEKGIRQWLINLCTSLMLIHKITPSVDYNLWLKRLDPQLTEPTNQNSKKIPKVVEPSNKKTLLKSFGGKCNK